MKDIIWNPHAREFVRSLPKELKREIGTFLFLLQEGEILGPPLSRKMAIIHRNAFELRLRDKDGIIRIIYVLALKDKVLIPHGFRKKAQKTPRKEIKTATARLKEML